jgi:AcrR family transcriptional regulator
MAGKVEKRREELRNKLIDIAEERIAAGGIDAIKARDLAKQAGCAVGAIYNVFGDLQDIVIAVNGRTFQRLGRRVAAAIDAASDASPTEQLIIISRAYLQFASDHPRLWRTLFDLQMSIESEVPAWYLQELARLFSFISAPLRQVFPEKSDHEIELLTRALFSSVHGIVLLGLENRISAVPRAQLEEMIALILRNVTREQTVS